MKVHFHPVPPPLTPPAPPPKTMPSAFDIALRTEQLIELAHEQRALRLKRDKMFADKKKAAKEKASADTPKSEEETPNPDDTAFDFLT